MLIVAFSLISTGNSTSQSSDTVHFGNGYFKSAPTAHDNNGTVNVGLSTGKSNSPKIYLAYQHFTGDLTHDPTIGIVPSGSSSTSTKSGLISRVAVPDLSKDSLLATTVISSLVVIAIPSVIYSRKRKS